MKSVTWIDVVMALIRVLERVTSREFVLSLAITVSAHVALMAKLIQEETYALLLGGLAGGYMTIKKFAEHKARMNGHVRGPVVPVYTQPTVARGEIPNAED